MIVQTEEISTRMNGKGKMLLAGDLPGPLVGLVRRPHPAVRDALEPMRYAK